jgi:hypothetical protein
MGREVYHGDPNGNLSERKAYDDGVREGAFGLLLNSVRTYEQFVYHNFYMTVVRCICIRSIPGMNVSTNRLILEMVQKLSYFMVVLKHNYWL